MPHGKIIHAAPYISLADFRPAGRNKIKIMLSGGFADRKHTARLASVEFCALAQNYARSRGAIPFLEIASAISRNLVVLVCKEFSHLLGELERGVVAHALLAVVDGRDLEDDGKVPAGRDRDGDGRYLHVETFGVLRLDAKAVIRLAVAPGNHVDDEVNVAAVLDRAHAEKLGDVDNADTAQLDIVSQHLGRIAGKIPSGFRPRRPRSGGARA